jgi:hypothetical protein
MRGFMFQGLSEPTNDVLRARMKRFAGLYMNEDPDAPNYDPVHKIIKSIWNGSKGPMMRKATVYDWVGDPVAGRFHLLHHPGRMDQMYDLEERYPKMLAHCAEYLDSVGDNFLNLAATNLHLNAYMLTHEEKYRDWVIEYVNARRPPGEMFRRTSASTASRAVNTTASGGKEPTAGTSRSSMANWSRLRTATTIRRGLGPASAMRSC